MLGRVPPVLLLAVVLLGGGLIALAPLAGDMVSGARTDASPGTTTRVSVDSSGNEGNGQSVFSTGHDPAISADGRYVAFDSLATNLVAGDTNGYWDIFMHDGQTGETMRVSVDSAGNQANEDSWLPCVSGDGRYVAFTSWATNLVQGDKNGRDDIFVRDRQAGITVLVSVSSTGVQADYLSQSPSISADGRYVAFTSGASSLVPGVTGSQIYLHDRDADEDGLFDEPGAISTVLVSRDSAGVQGNGDSSQSSLSADGRYVAFRSESSNLVQGDTNSADDVFVHEPRTGETTRVSVGSAGSEANGPSYYPAISADGRYVAFASAASNLVQGDTNGVSDVFVHDRDADGNGVFDEAGGTATELVSVDSAGTQGNAGSGEAAVTTDGRLVTFASSASNLVAGDTNGASDVFVHDSQTGETTRVSVDSAGNQANADSNSGTISGDGRYVAFSSRASNLVSGDRNATLDAFVHERLLPLLTPTPTARATPTPAAVSGTAGPPPLSGTPAGEAAAPAEGSGWSAGSYAALAAGLAAALLALIAGGWYARRRWHRP
jgi:Tol biopolymer transport system component